MFYSGKSLSAFLQHRTHIFLYLILGWKVAKFLVFALGKLYHYFHRKEKECIENALTEVIGTKAKAADIESVTKKVFAGIYAHYYEKMFMAFEEPGKATRFLLQNILSDDLQKLHRKLSRGKGVIIVTGHYGAIEFIPTLLAVHGFPVSMIAKFKTKKLKEKTFSQAMKYNIKLIDAEVERNIMSAAMNDLRNGRILITQCDEIHEWRPSRKHEMTFLGRRTGVDRTIHIFQKRTGAEVIFGIIHRYSMSRYRLMMYTYEDMLEMIHHASGAPVGEILLNFLERFIYSNPEQWYQWSKYATIDNLQQDHHRVETGYSAPVLKPAFEGIL